MNAVKFKDFFVPCATSAKKIAILFTPKNDIKLLRPGHSTNNFVRLQQVSSSYILRHALSKFKKVNFKSISNSCLAAQQQRLNLRPNLQK